MARPDRTAVRRTPLRVLYARHGHIRQPDRSVRIGLRMSIEKGETARKRSNGCTSKRNVCGNDKIMARLVHTRTMNSII
jgi:hypothetical protein